MAKEKQGKTDWFKRFLTVVERVGNALPHPATLFLIFAILILIISALTSLMDISVIHPGTGETISPVNLLSREGFHMILSNMVENFTGFAPLGVVLVAMLGIGVAESSGLVGAALKLLVLSSP
ncbi:MAG: AbgT family transporter, partial [Bacteroidota bacterium]